MRINEKDCLEISGAVTNYEWITTNDIVVFENEGFRILGRADSAINSGGIKILAEILEKEISFIIDSICEDYKRALPENLHANFQEVFKKCERAKTPWFFGSMLMDDDEIDTFVKDSALANVEDVFYVEEFICINGKTRAIVII